MSDLDAFEAVSAAPRRPWIGVAALSTAAIALAAALGFALFLVWEWREESRETWAALRGAIVSEPRLRAIVAEEARARPAEAALRGPDVARAVVDLIKIELPPLIQPITVVSTEAPPPLPARAEAMSDLVLRQTVPFPRIGSEGDGEIERAIAMLTAEWRKQAPNGDCALVVEGHTDTKGSDEANLRLSERRARFVAGILEKQLDSARVTTHGWGERRLLVLTPDATDELANRRVEVTLTCPPVVVAAN